MDTGRPHIDIVREREEGGPETFDTARDQYAQKQAKIDREAGIDHPVAEDPEEFQQRMAEKLKESGKEHADER